MSTGILEKADWRGRRLEKAKEQARLTTMCRLRLEKLQSRPGFVSTTATLSRYQLKALAPMEMGQDPTYTENERAQCGIGQVNAARSVREKKQKAVNRFCLATGRTSPLPALRMRLDSRF